MGGSRMGNLMPALVAGALAGGLVLVAALLSAVGQAGGAAYLFLALALAIGAALLRGGRPAEYAGFVWWLWMLTPLVRRLIDLRAGWNPANPIVLTPLLVTGLSMLVVVRHAPAFRRRSLAPFAAAGAAVTLGLLVGAFRAPLPPVVYGGLTWLVPIGFGAWIALRSDADQAISRALVLTFAAALCVVGVYGVLQYVAPAAWDRYWMDSAQMNSIGKPRPFEVRVFSTLNSPGALAPVLCTMLICVIASRLRWRLLPVALGAVVLVLTQGRTAVIALVAGIGVLACLAPRWAARTYGAALLGVTLIASLSIGAGATVLTDDAVARTAEMLSRRFETIADLGGDRSFYERQAIVRRTLALIADRPMGYGLGTTGTGQRLAGGAEIAFDNGVLEVIYALGWIGATLFYGAILWLAIGNPRWGASRTMLERASLALLVVTAIQLLSGNQFEGPAGLAFWISAGLLTSARRARIGHVGRVGTVPTTRVVQLGSRPSLTAACPPACVAGGAA